MQKRSSIARRIAWVALPAYGCLFILLSLLSFKMLAAANIRAITEPFAHNERHFIGSHEIDLLSNKLIARRVLAPVQGFFSDISVESVTIDFGARSMWSQLCFLLYPEGDYEVRLENLKVHNPDIKEKDLVSDNDVGEETSFDVEATIKVKKDKTLELMSVNSLSFSGKGKAEIPLKYKQLIVLWVNQYLPKGSYN